MKLWEYQKPYNKKKKIMLMGSPLHQVRKPVCLGNPLVRLELELRLVESIKKGGYESIYKVHPDREREIRSIFEDRAKVIYGKFEKMLREIISSVDILLFPYVATTAFSPALCTPMPIVALDVGFDEAFPEVAELLKKRIEIIPTWHDERNRLLYDEDKLLNTFSFVQGMYSK